MTALPTHDPDRFQLVREQLYTPVVGDILDSMGRLHQFLPAGIRPIRPEMVVVGRAMPVLITDVFRPVKEPFGQMMEALDSLRPGEVYLARSGRLDCSAWGEILTVTARVRGAVGAVIDGFHRDTGRVLAQDWPVFSRGSYAQDAAARSSVIDFRVPAEIEGVQVTPGDLVFGDVDGVLVVPRSIEDEVLEAALVKANAENTTRAAIEEGMSSRAAYERFGVL